MRRQHEQQQLKSQKRQSSVSTSVGKEKLKTSNKLSSRRLHSPTSLKIGHKSMIVTKENVVNSVINKSKISSSSLSGAVEQIKMRSKNSNRKLGLLADFASRNSIVSSEGSANLSQSKILKKKIRKTDSSDNSSNSSFSCQSEEKKITSGSPGRSSSSSSTQNRYSFVKSSIQPPAFTYVKNSIQEELMEESPFSPAQKKNAFTTKQLDQKLE